MPHVSSMYKIKLTCMPQYYLCVIYALKGNGDVSHKLTSMPHMLSMHKNKTYLHATTLPMCYLCTKQKK